LASRASMASHRDVFNWPLILDCILIDFTNFDGFTVASSTDHCHWIAP
jgi:hypothetical protein